MKMEARDEAKGLQRPLASEYNLMGLEASSAILLGEDALSLFVALRMTLSMGIFDLSQRMKSPFASAVTVP